ncbi:MAG TPA: phosphopantetheine-binding protein, partial [Gemmatimonadaceae bacterium]|nr:phosphopantetheine-binding protein [Gemmatimonadaceae bacterium]
AEVLKREPIGVTDNFLALGGHSLLAIRVLGRISKTFGVRLPLRTLFETPTIEALAAAIDRARAG